jgi:membrane protease YdiL (CAAX protease family)
MASWMILSIPLIFLPIILCGLLLLRSANNAKNWRERLRLRRLSSQDWLWSVVGLIGIGLGSWIALKLCTTLGLNPQPPFARNLQPWIGNRVWMFGLWVVYWPINILGEELVWRGVLLPRMETYMGNLAWLFNAFLWGIFHLAFGIGNLVVLLPTLMIVPLIAQRQKSTWIAILLHAGLSGPGFLAIALGLL